jgi:NAD(P)-dependent dehydrogenase (short-subunit alcohol dehydrogenase family)
MDPNTRFKMKPVALITGGSRGIGLGIAQALVKQSYRVAINGVRAADQVVEPLKQLNAEGGEAIYCQGNVGSADDRRKIMEDIKAKWGQLNLLVNNAGVAPKERKDILEADEQSFDWLMGINLKGPYFLTQQAANWMIEQKTKNSKDSFSIINISSVSATIASVNRGEYCISKAGMSMSTKLWAARLGEFDIPVYEIQPGVIRTDMTAGVIEKYDKMIAAGLTLQRRWGQPEDLGKTVIALAEGMIPYATGQIIHTDGGMTIQTL